MRIEQAEALRCLEQLQVGELQPLAQHALESNHFGEAILELAERPPGTWRDAEDLFDRMLREMGRAPITKREAGLRLAKDVAARIVSGEIDPHAGASRIWWTIWNETDRPDEPLVFVSLADEYEENPAHRSELCREIVEEAERLLEG